MTDPTARPAWVDGDPLMEAIAAAVWEHCRTEGTSLVVDDPRNIAAAATAAVSSPPPNQTALSRIVEVLRPHASLGGTPPRYQLPFFDGATPSLPRISGWKPLDDVAAALAAVLPPTVDRAAEFELRGTAEIRAAALLEAADFVRGLLLTRTSITTAGLEAELRRLAAEAPQPERPAVETAEDRCAECGHFRGAHEEAEEPVSVGRCTVCADDDAWHNYEPTEEERRLAAEAQPEAPWATDGARIGRALIWSWARVGDTDFGRGYRTAQEDVRAILTRPLLGAGVQQQPDTETEAHPPEHAWKVESPRRDTWASWGATYDDRDWALERYESAVEHAPGRPFRLVRATTAYTVEAEHQPAAEAQPVEPHPTEADLRHALAVLDAFQGRDAGAPDVEAQTVQHAPGIAVRCPDCRAKGYSVCMTDDVQHAADDTSEEAGA